MRALLIVCLVPALFACSKSSDGSSSTRNERFSYSLTYNNCPTGKKTFSSQQAMCDALKDDSENNYCAREMRREKFDSDACAGNFDDPSQTLDPVVEQPEEELPSPVVTPPAPNDDGLFERRDPKAISHIGLEGKITVKNKRASASGDFLFSRAEGTIRLNGGGNLKLDLTGASSVEVVTPRHSCQLTSLIFSNIDSFNELNFSIAGQDSLRTSPPAESCLSKVYKMVDEGFNVVFFNVPTSSSNVIPTVTLKVNP